jgi:hypothetical protein
MIRMLALNGSNFLSHGSGGFERIDRWKNDKYQKTTEDNAAHSQTSPCC